MSLEWDKLYKLGTDVAGFLFFHPTCLAHRKDDPTGWWGDDFAEEFRAGRLVAFCTGSDGTFTLLRQTQCGDLLPRYCQSTVERRVDPHPKVGAFPVARRRHRHAQECPQLIVHEPGHRCIAPM
jgi:hypothetical protein